MSLKSSLWHTFGNVVLIHESGPESPVLCHAPLPLVSIGGGVSGDPVIGGGSPRPCASRAPVIKLAPDAVLISLENNWTKIYTCKGYFTWSLSIFSLSSAISGYRAFCSSVSSILDKNKLKKIFWGKKIFYCRWASGVSVTRDWRPVIGGGVCHGVAGEGAGVNKK